MVTATQLGQVIATIYRAPISSDAWMPALKAVEDLTSSTFAPLQILPKDGGAKKCLIGRLAPEAGLQEWFRDYLPRCKRIAYAMSHPVGVLRYDYQILTEREMDRDPVYRYYESLDYRYFLGMKLHEDDRQAILFALQRRRSLGHAQRADIKLFQLIVPHIQQALQLSSAFQTLQSKAEMTSDLLNGSPKPVIFASSVGELMFRNAAAEELLRNRDGLLLGDGQLLTADPLQQQHFDAMIAGAFAGTFERRDWRMQLHRPGGRRPHSVSVSRLNAPTDGSLFGCDKVAAVTVSLAQMPSRAGAAARQLFGLTPAEAKVASAFASGHSVESCAAALGISRNTIRTHLKALFKKVGVNRQQDLCRILTNIG